ncbi:MAG: Bacteriophage repressor helix-turn-helix domain [Firmicutes bacterium]|nr:Bacteriophage repressor helix-turn-helix domain [Bacillota bacterium]
MKICERIFDLLPNKRGEQAKLAIFLGIRPNTISDWKAKKIDPSPNLIPAIARYLNVSVSYLLTGEENEIVTNSTIVKGENISRNVINNNGDNHIDTKLDEQEKELLRIFRNLSVKEKIFLLSKGYELEENK